MNNTIEEIKKELKELCSDYLNILQHLKDKEVIDKETFEKCTNNKKIFLEE